VSVTGDRQNAVLDAVVEHLRAEARSYAAQVRLLTELGELTRWEGQIGGVPQFPMIELAGSARVGQTTATRLLVDADRLVTALPLTVTLLESAELLVHQAKVLLAETGSCAVDVGRPRPRCCPAPLSSAQPTFASRSKRRCCAPRASSTRPTSSAEPSSVSPTPRLSAARSAARSRTAWAWRARS
jgi:hypothetical protein